jgi:hypothetical protein
MPEARTQALLFEFTNGDDLLAAAGRVRAAGFRRLDAFSPFPLEGLAETLGDRASRIPWFALAGGIAGALGGLFMQWYANVVSYPINVGGRPLAAWPAFILPAFELAVLFAVLAAVVGMLVENGLPRLHHPVFAAERFGCASDDRFFLWIGTADPRLRNPESRAVLDDLGAIAVHEVAA